MATYQIAHIRKQGQDIIIVPLESQFHYKPAAEKESFRNALERCATHAKLNGTVCLVWQHGQRLHSIAPKPWHPFFKSLTMDYVARRINKKIACNFR